MNILIIGANGLLSSKLIDFYSKDNNEFILTARNIEKVKVHEKSKVIKLDFDSKESINDFFKASIGFKELDLIIFCSSPFEGTLKKSSFNELSVWGNSYDVALKVAHLASQKLNSEGKLIYIGSVVGYQGQIAASCVPYSVFKGSLSLLVEGYNKEVSNQAHYINLGGFRESKTDEYLSADEVVNSISKVINGDVLESHVNVVSDSDKDKYGL